MIVFVILLVRCVLRCSSDDGGGDVTGGVGGVCRSRKSRAPMMVVVDVIFGGGVMI
ncbi:hypothetical protein HanHA300_Chr13g0498981 [Helianthus annuus]|nr:hypothetical protein HanHA300_Chr13g0498981 [Helianthus annuus]